MDNKLNRFFEKINFVDNKEFVNSKVTKVTINKIDESWTVYIENNEYIEPDTLLNLIELCKKGIKDVSQINIKYTNINLKEDKIINYFKYVLNKIVKESPALSSIINNNITIENKTITIEVISELEQKLIKKESKQILDFLDEIGVGDYNINCNINEKLKEEVRKEISETPVEIIKKENVNSIIMGEEIKSKISTIDSIIG